MLDFTRILFAFLNLHEKKSLLQKAKKIFFRKNQKRVQKTLSIRKNANF
jgi:hypothetical protein